MATDAQAAHYPMRLSHCHLRSIPLGIVTEYSTYTSFAIAKNRPHLARLVRRAMGELKIVSLVPRIEDAYYRAIDKEEAKCERQHNAPMVTPTMGLVNVAGPCILLLTLAAAGGILLVGELALERIRVSRP